MNRLTRWNGKKWVLPQGCWREIAERLAAYEDTGLEPEQVVELKNGVIAEEATRDKSIHDLFTASVIVHDKAGNVPYVDPTSGNAYLYSCEVEANTDNPKALQEPGINHLVIAVYRDHWHVEQVCGYTPEIGSYVKSFPLEYGRGCNPWQ